VHQVGNWNKSIQAEVYFYCRLIGLVQAYKLKTLYKFIYLEVRHVSDWVWALVRCDGLVGGFLCLTGYVEYIPYICLLAICTVQSSTRNSTQRTTSSYPVPTFFQLALPLACSLHCLKRNFVLANATILRTLRNFMPVFPSPNIIHHIATDADNKLR
jgi:hypothetical protein